MNNKYNSLMSEKNKMNILINDYRNKNNELELLNQELSNRITVTDKYYNEDFSNEKDLLYNIQKAIKQIYQNHILGDSNNNINITISEMAMLKEIDDKLNDMQNNSNNNQLINVNIIYNEDFAGMEQNKNSQLYENILLYIFHIRTQNKIEINKIINNYSELNNNKNNINNINNQNNINQILENLKNELDEKCMNFEKRLKYSVNIDEIEQLVWEIKGLYESIIDRIMKFFYDNKKDLSVNNILIIQLPLDKYHQFINNTNSNLSKIESSLVNKINEYKSQGGKIDSALNILIDNVNSLKN